MIQWISKFYAGEGYIYSMLTTRFEVFTSSSFWDVMMCCWVNSSDVLKDPEDEGTAVH